MVSELAYLPVHSGLSMASLNNSFLCTEVALFHGVWKDYNRDKPDHSFATLDDSKSTIKAWRQHSWLLLSAWRALMQQLLPPSAWELTELLLERRSQLRNIWLKEGGWLITTAGRRRKRRFKGLRKPNPRTLGKEIDRIQELLDKITDKELADRIEIALLVCSGVIYGGEVDRLAAMTRVRDNDRKLKLKLERP